MRFSSLILVFFLQLTASFAQETLLLRSPSISDDKIAFAYAADVWIAEKDGSNPRRITVNPDVESDPVISPDGKWIAFTGNYDGNIDVYVVPSTGGVPKRLSFHPAAEWVRGWTGNKIIFASNKTSYHPRHNKLFTIDASTGIEEEMKFPEANQASFSPDGKFTAYIKNPDPNYGPRAYRPFKLYRGGLMPKIWIMNNSTNDVEEIPGSKGNNSYRPVWAAGIIYFISDRDNHTANIYSFNPTSKEVKQVTKYTDYDVKTLQSNGKDLCFEQDGRLHILNAANGEVKNLSINLNADLQTKRPHYENAESFIRDFDISPTGVRAVFEARGEILTLPVEKGEARNITNTVGAHERSPAWSTDGKYIAYFSDESGEYKLKLKDQKGEKDPITINLAEKDFYYDPIWSPDSKKILYSDKHLRLYYIDLTEKKPVYIDKDTYDRPDAFFYPSWSPDGKWIVYNRKLENNLRALFLYQISSGKSTQITDGRSEAAYPTFSRDGRFIFFTASTNYGRSVGWLDMTSYEIPVRNSIYAIVLSGTGASPVAPESDEEVIKIDTGKAKPPAPGVESKTITVDLAGIDQRIIALPLPVSNYSNLLGNAEGKLFYLQGEPGDNSTTLMSYDIAKRKSEMYAQNVMYYKISADGKKLLFNTAPGNTIASTQNKPAPGDGKISLSGVRILVDPEKEWKQMFEEVWRIERDFFYVENLHGANWEKVKQKYEKFLPYVGHREDLSYLFNEMMAELVIGHNYVNQGDYPDPISVNVGLLGADYETSNGFYKFKKIYSGLNWNPEFRAPLTQPGVSVHEGDYLLAVNGVPLDGKTNLYSLFQNTASKQTRILVNNQPRMEGAKEFIVVPLANESNLRLINWVEGNRKKVDELSKGRLAYVYLPNTAGDGYNFFNRYYFSQLEKDGVVVDERYNGGGSAADYIVDYLGRKVTNYWKNRDGDVMKTPEAVIDGPMAMVTNGYAGSGGDLLPFLFRFKKLGPLVGTTTHGILVGIYRYPILMDGGFVTAPRLGIFSLDNKWIIENEGVSPDVEVEMTPKEVMQGKDPQLEKAIELVMKDLKPKTKVQPPKDPVRAVN